VEHDKDRVHLEPELIARYLRLLGVARRPPSLEALKELVRGQLTRIPFENISKLYYKKHFGLGDIAAIGDYLDGVEKKHFGGTCYSNNFHFHCLLASLGYDAKLCSADMAVPDVHAVNIVNVDGHEYLVDPGYAAPFLEPLPRDLRTDFAISLGRDRYVLKPKDSCGRSRLELYRNGVLKHGYLAKPAPKTIGDFGGVIADSFRREATFLNSILVARFFPGRSVVIHNLAVIYSRGESCDTRRLSSLEDAAAAIHQEVGIPREIVLDAVAELKDMQDAWGDPFLGGRDHQA